MKRFVSGVLLVAMAMMWAGCGENAPSAQTPANPSQTARPKLFESSAQPVSGNPTVVIQPGKSPGGGTDGLVAPKDARFSIYCGTIGGEGHMAQARRLKDDLVARTRMRDWYTVSSDEGTSIYYGFYRDHEVNTADGKQAHADLKLIAGMVNRTGDPLFNAAMLMPLTAADPPAPPEWDLKNQSKHGYWSLQIGAYEKVSDRKQLAVDAVSELNKAGIKSYFYHGDTVSSVCVGLWPKNAVTWDRRNVDEAIGANPTLPVLVSNVQFPPGTSEHVTLPDGTPVQAYWPQGVTPVDATLKEMLRRFPTHSVNGYDIKKRHTDVMSHQTIEVLDPSFLVVVPGADEHSGATPAAEDPNPFHQQAPMSSPDVFQPLPGPAQPPRSQPGAGKLKGIGE